MASWINRFSRDRRRPAAAFAALVGAAAFACAAGTGASVSQLGRGPDANTRRDPSPHDPVLEVTPALARSIDPVTPVVDEVTTRLHALEVLTGEATYYADKFDGRRTASGIVFRQREAYAAHRTLPFGTVVRVTNERNGRSVVVRVVDRGPWGSTAKQRNTIIDLSRSAAEQLGYIRAGRTPVRVEVLHRGPGA